MEVRNCKISKIYQGPTKASNGVDMPGIAGPVWHYADLFIQLENGVILRIACGETGMVESLPKKSIHIRDKKLRIIENKNSIIDIYFANETPLIYILLDDGSHIEYSYRPGGSYWQIDRFDESFIDNTEDGFDDIFTSIVNMNTLTWNQLVVWNTDMDNKKYE